MFRAPACLLLSLCCFPLGAQKPETQPTNDHPYTLHVYNNLIQFPTIVLDENLRPLPPLSRQMFDISLDSGPVFHPTQMRREGDDPISLAVLLDAGGSQKDLLSGFADAFQQLIPASLHPSDHISIYAEDCKLMRALHNEPADAGLVKAAIEAVLADPKVHGGKSKPACGRELHLWDNLLAITADLATEPGRRVILLVSDGDESKSKNAYADVSRLIATSGNALFRLQDADNPPMFGAPMFTPRGGDIGFGNAYRSEDLVRALCDKTGGMGLQTRPQHLAKQLQEFITILRSRYVLEFPRPDDHIAGRHNIVITLANKRAFIRYTGVTTPLPDPALAADPNTLPSASSPAVFGPRHSP